MRLKVFTSACLVFVVILMLGWPFIVGAAPERDAPWSARRAFSIRALVVVGGAALGLVGASIGALLILRQARREYSEQARENLKGLLEGTRQDHRAKAPEEDA